MIPYFVDKGSRPALAGLHSWTLAVVKRRSRYRETYGILSFCNVRVKLKSASGKCQEFLKMRQVVTLENLSYATTSSNMFI